MSTGNAQQAPRARSRNIIVQELPHELLVYDLVRHRAHCLNKTAALVWKDCTGELMPAEMARNLSLKTGLEITEELVVLALEQLGRARLLDHSVVKGAAKDPLVRRQMVRRIGLLAVGVPLVTSLIVPDALASVSKNCVGINGFCDATGAIAPPCCSGFVCVANICNPA